MDDKECVIFQTVHIVIELGTKTSSLTLHLVIQYFYIAAYVNIG